MKEQLSPHRFGVLMNQKLLSSLVCIMMFYFKCVIRTIHGEKLIVL